VAESQPSDKLAALAAEIRAHANVYRSAVALASMLELLGPYEEAEVRARAACAEEQQKLAAAQAATADAERGLAAVKREHERAVSRMTKELEGMLAAREREIDSALATKLGELKRVGDELDTANAHMKLVNDRLGELRRIIG
jgi:DNA-binding helix-hairpin-helix protein with protein kinase domain